MGGPVFYYEHRRGVLHPPHVHGPGCNHDNDDAHSHDDHHHSGCCGHDHVADMEFQAEQTIRLASVTLRVVRAQKESKSKSLHEDVNKQVQEYVERQLMGQREDLKTHKYALHFKAEFENYDHNQKVKKGSDCCGDHSHHEHGSAECCHGCDESSKRREL